MATFKALVLGRLLTFRYCETSHTISQIAGVRLNPIPLEGELTHLTYCMENGKEWTCTPDQAKQLLIVRDGFARLLQHHKKVTTLILKIEATKNSLGKIQEDSQTQDGTLSALQSSIEEIEGALVTRINEIDAGIRGTKKDLATQDKARQQLGKAIYEVNEEAARKISEIEASLISEAERAQQMSSLRTESRNVFLDLKAALTACVEELNRLQQELNTRGLSKQVDLETGTGDGCLLDLNRQLLQLKEEKASQEQALDEQREPLVAQLVELTRSLEETSATLYDTLCRTLDARNDLTLEGVPELAEHLATGCNAVSVAPLEIKDHTLTCPWLVTVGEETYHCVYNSRMQNPNGMKILSDMVF